MSHCFSFLEIRAPVREGKVQELKSAGGTTWGVLPVVVYLTIFSFRNAEAISYLSSLLQVLPSMLFFSLCCYWSCWTFVSWYLSTDSEPIRLTICYRIKPRISSMVSKILLWSQPPSQSSLSISSVFRQAKYFPFLNHISWDLSSWSWRPVTQGSHFPLPQIIYIFISIERS